MISQDYIIARVDAAVKECIQDIGPNPRAVLTAYVGAIADVSECEWADYLEWSDDESLKPFASSNDEADLAALFNAGSYKRGEGITGSALLLDRNASKRYSGTNDFDHDPRQSRRHTLEYEKETGPIANYFVFPMFEGERAVYAFRVVNRQRSAWNAGVPWSPWILDSLQRLAVWTEHELMPAIVNWRSVATPPVSRKDEWRPSRVVSTLAGMSEFEWVSDGFLAEIIEHIRSVAFRQVEKNRLGCCIGVFDGGVIPELLSLFQPYKTAGRGQMPGLEEQSRAYPFVSPTQGMFVYGGNGVGYGVVNLKLDNRHSVECMAWLTDHHPESVIFLLERDKYCIRIFMSGRLAADYYLSDETGLWRLRAYNPLKNQVTSAFPKAQHNLIRSLIDHAVDLSYQRIGSMIVLADDLPDELSGANQSAEALYLESLSGTELADIARVDGAIVVNSQSQVTHWGAIFGRMSAAHPDLQERHGQEQGLGSRHNTAKDVSRIARDALFLVVSENRPISAAKAGEWLVKKDRLT